MIKFGDSIKIVPEEKQWLFFKHFGLGYIHLEVGCFGIRHALVIKGIGFHVANKPHLKPVNMFKKWKISIPHESSKKIFVLGFERIPKYVGQL